MFTNVTEVIKSWIPAKPTVLKQSKNSVELSFAQPEPYCNLQEAFLYRVQTNAKVLGWVNVYCGGNQTQTINNLQPGRPHKFRLQIILRTSKFAALNFKNILQGNSYNNVKHLSQKFEILETKKENFINGNSNDQTKINVENNYYTAIDEFNINLNITGYINKEKIIDNEFENKSIKADIAKEISFTETAVETNLNVLNNLNMLNVNLNMLNNYKTDQCIESKWSEEVQSITDPEGPSVVCFCMAVRCGYVKQVQSMLEEKPELIDICNSTDGFTPLATAVRKGNTQMVRFLLNAGADVNQRSSTSQTPLQLAVLSANIPLTEILIERGADITAKDQNGLSLMHYAVDSADLPMTRHVLRLADVAVVDNKGWTPLHRAVIQGAPSPIIQELLNQGCDVEQPDRRGLTCPQLASLLKRRDDVRRLVDKNFIHEKAVTNFTKLTKKLSTIHSLMGK